MMTVPVSLKSCTPQIEELETIGKAMQGNNIDEGKGEELKNVQVKCDAQGTDNSTSSLKIAEDSKNESSEVVSSLGVPSEPSKENAIVATQGDPPEVSDSTAGVSKTTKQGRAVGRGRRKSDTKEYNPKNQVGGRNRGRKISKSSNRDYENSSSNGGNSGADGNGEDNGSDDDDDDDDADEDDDDDDDDDEDDGEDDEDDDDEEESKNEDDDDDTISLNGNEKNGKDVKIKQEPADDQETLPTPLQGFMAGLDGNIPLADLLEKLPNSVCPGDENNTAPAAPGVPVTLNGIVCHETGGVLVVNIKWRNKFYCGSLIDCSRHAWASPRFPAMDGSESDMKMGGKGGKGRKRQKNNSVSSSPGNVNKEATPLKHKLRGRKRGVSGCPTPKSQGFKGMGKRRSKNMDDDDDGPRPGKRSCTMKTTVSPQPSPTLIECPEPGCDKKYKHINGLRYHQAHAHLEESNQSDDRSASTSPSPVEEFKEPDTKTSFKGRTSRVSARARSVSPSLAAAIAAINERKNESSKFGKKKETTEQTLDSTNAKEINVSKSPIPTNDEDSVMDDTSVSYVESSDKCQQACEHMIKKENDHQKNIDMVKREIESKTGFKPVEDEQQTALKNLEKEQLKDATDLSTCTTTTGEPKIETSDTGKNRIKSEAPQGNQEVWETVIDSGFSGTNDSKSPSVEERISISQVEDMEKALGESKHVSIPGMQPVDLRQAVDAGVGLINQLGIEVEDISENEEDIDPGQDSEYASKDVSSLSCSTALTEHKNSSGINTLRGLPVTASESYLPQMSKSGVSSEALRTKPGSSLHFDGKDSKEPDAKYVSKFDSSKNSDLWSNNASKNLSEKSFGLQRKIETKPTALVDKTVKTASSGISMEALVSKSISRSAVEPPLINSDAPSMRYKFFECRNYGDDNYDKCIRTSEFDQKGSVDSKATLAPIRYPELVRNGSVSEPPKTQKDSPSDPEGARMGLKTSFDSKAEESCTDGKVNNKNLSLPTSSTRTRSPMPEGLNRNLNLPDKARLSMEPQHSTKSPSSAILLTPSRPGFDSSSRSPASVSNSGSKVERKTPSNPFQPVIVKHEFQPTEAGKGIQQELNTQAFTQSDSKLQFMSSMALMSGDQGKLSNTSGTRESSLPGQGTEDNEKSYKASARALSRPQPGLISRNSNALPPSLPVGVAHPYPRASDGGLVSSRLKASENKTSATASVTSVTYSSTSPRPSSLDVPTELPQPENKAKQLQTLQVPIPVGEVSPVSLKRSPGPAIHSGLPSVMSMLGPGIKTQGSVSSHPSIRAGLKVPGMNEQVRSERKSETLLREPSPYATSKSPVPRSLAMPKATPELKSPQQQATSSGPYQKAKASDDSSREDSEVIVVKEEPLSYGPPKNKPVAEKERDRERRDVRDTAAAEMSYGSQEPISAEQLRNLQLQQQLTLQQYYQPFMQAGGMSLEMMKSLSQLAYMQGMPVDPKATLAAQAQLFQNMQPEQQMQLLQLHRQMMLEQEKKGMHRSSSAGHLDARGFEKKETPKPSDRLHESERRMDESGIKKSPQGRAHQDESDFRRYPSQSESLQYASSRGSSPRVTPHKLSPDEPPEKKSRADDSYERERELERLKYKREEEFLQKQKHLQQISMFKQLENEQQSKQMGGSFPRKQQTTPEKSGRLGNSREEERAENKTGSGRDLIYHRPQESSTSTIKSSHHSFEAESSQGSPRSHVVKSQSLSAPRSPRSPRSSRSPVPTSRYKDSAASDEKRDGSNSHPANFIQTQFQAYLSQLNFDPAAGQLHYMAPQFPVPPGLVMSMPGASPGESSKVTSVASSSQEREARSPYRNTERDRNSTPTSYSNSQSRTSSSESNERLQRLKDSAEKETRRSPVMYPEERSRNRNTASEQNVSPKSSSRTLDFKGEDGSMSSHPSIISNNLAISRMAGHMDVLTEEEIIRRQRFAAEYGDPSQAMHMGYYVPPGLIGQIDPAYAASMMHSSQHMGRGVEHYMTKRQ